MKKLLLVLFIQTSACCLSIGQIVWDHTLIPDTTTGFCVACGADAQTVLQTRDHGYIIAGDLLSDFSFNDRIGFWSKLDSAGHAEWTHVIETSHNTRIWAIVENEDSTLLFCSTLYHYSSDLYTPVLFKTDKSGDIIWSKAFQGNDIVAIHDMKKTSDGGFIVLGNTAYLPYNDFYRDIVLIKMDSSLNITWSKTYGGNSRDVGYSIALTPDSGFMISGYTESFGTLSDVYVINTDQSGNLLWSKTYGYAGFSEGLSIVKTFDNNYVITGFPFTYWYYNSGALKINSSGDTLWSRTLGYADSLFILSAIQATDSNLILMGVKPYPSLKTYLIKMDQSANMIWCRAFGNSTFGRPTFHSILQANDNGFLFVGGYYNEVVKTDSACIGPCGFTTSVFDIGHASLQVMVAATNVATDTIQLINVNYSEIAPIYPMIIDNCSLLNVASALPDNLNFTLSPNPVTNQLDVRDSENELKQFDIFNALGEMVMTVCCGIPNADCRLFPSGVYFVKIYSGSNSVVKKLIKN